MTSINWAREEAQRGDNITVESRNSSVPGTFVIEVRHAVMPMPVCSVWCRWVEKNKTIEILHSFTVQSWRRCGLRSVAHKKITEWVDRIVTDVATIDGERFLKSAGFKHLPSGRWEWRKRTLRKKK